MVKVMLKYLNLGMVVHACNLGTQEVEPGQLLQVQGQPSLHSKFKAILPSETLSQKEFIFEFCFIIYKELFTFMLFLSLW